MQRLRTRLRAGATAFPPATFALNFLTGALDSGVTFTRGTTATFVGSNGLIQTAAINAPRFDYDPVTLAAKGLLIEEQRTNLLTYSEQFDNAAWTKSNGTITANAAASPDGTATADTLVENTATSTHWVGRNIAASASTIYTASIFVKAAGRTAGQFQIFGNSGGSTVSFNLSTGTSTAAGAYGGWASASTTITNFGNGWYRITNTATTNAGLTSFDYRLFLENPAGTPTYTGDGTSGMLLYNAQLEAGSFATSYIPTVASQVTRSADVATMTGTNFSSWYNQSEGTFVASFDQNAVNSEVGYVGEVRTDNNNRIQLFANNGAGQTQFTVRNGGVVQADLATTGSITQGAVIKAAYAYKASDFATVRDGGAAAAGSTGSIPTVTSFLIGSTQVASNLELNGHIRQIAYYNTRLSNATLQALTA
jgi:hypothetical protein